MKAYRIAALAGLCLLAACKEKKEEAETPDGNRVARARQLAEARLQSSLRVDGSQLRGVQVYRQAIAGTYAVCGQVNPGGADRPFLPFVSVVSFPDASKGGGGGDAPSVDQFVSMSAIEATRVYVEMTSRCGEDGGPRQSGNRVVPAPLPPVPGNLPYAGQPAAAPAAGAAAASPAAPTPAAPSTAPPATPQAAERGTPASGTVTMRQNGNLRAHPSGGGEVLRVLPRGAALRVFAEAPGGWYQVGEGGAPAGWVHGSMLDR
ncbi:SH3 domain-containing protein [Roseomonas sp. OT10]|uniref:SH3 domain-containing protein n=1 Tax=Roseomonas cutis TaxID=2897332 RepID=UPI001E3787D8|nr:SH3 domain-containing protein [Roseomonas sp. OT10]UFN47104.1 SH3 domain-containing protein [Roseomonas sp. OT10]